MEPFASLQELLTELNGIAEITPDGRFKVLDPGRMAGLVLDRLVWTAVFAEDTAVRDGARWIIRSAAAAQGILASSIQGLYDAFGRGDVEGFTVPAFNIRGSTYEMTRALFRAAKEINAALFICEIAKSEIGYTMQRPGEYATCVLAAALREGWKGPVFIQGDHYQMKAKKYFEDPDSEVKGIKDLIRESVDAGFYNIDIDSSTLVVLDRASVLEQQKDNYARCAELTAFIREIQPAGITVSVGGEIGEVGGKNSTVEEFEAFMEGYRTDLDKLMPRVKGISKMSVQTGTEHGGIPMPDGTIKDVAVDFSVLRDISKVAREKYAMGGTVQHGASTLPEDLFDQFPRNLAVEIHLATGFQNVFFEHPSFPRGFREEMYAWMKENLAAEFKEKLTEEQNLYKLRKKAWGPFKNRIWSLEDEMVNPILASLERKFVSLFTKLNAVNTSAMAEEYIRTSDAKPPMPDGLRQALAPAQG
ncbi:MAG: class II fructose-bisphosphate aldolase [Planctomycetota bacterium]